MEKELASCGPLIMTLLYLKQKQKTFESKNETVGF